MNWISVSVLAYCFTPLILTLSVLLAVWWKEIAAERRTRPGVDFPCLLLASATRWMTKERSEWGTAMVAEIPHIESSSSRWRFALSCLRTAIFPPPRAGMFHFLLAKQSSACGVFAILLPPLGWPFMLLAGAIFAVIGGSPFTQDSRWANPEAAITVWNVVKLITMGCFLAGLPLGLAGLFRRESRKWLSAMGIGSTAFAIVWFLLLGVFF
jgi:hypothetical protein